MIEKALTESGLKAADAAIVLEKLKAPIEEVKDRPYPERIEAALKVLEDLLSDEQRI